LQTVGPFVNDRSHRIVLLVLTRLPVMPVPTRVLPRCFGAPVRVVTVTAMNRYHELKKNTVTHWISLYLAQSFNTSPHTVLPVCLVKQLKCHCKLFTNFEAKFHTHTHTHTRTHTHTHAHARARCSSSSFIDALSLTRRTVCACAQFSGCSSTTNGHSETVQMTVCCKNLTLGALSSRSEPSLLVGAPCKTIGLFLNTHRIYWAQ
jgi:hypothetical protein